jgi:hypothetical protein
MLDTDMKKVIGVISGLGAALYFATPAWAQGTVLNLCPQGSGSGPDGETAATGFQNLCNVNAANALPGLITFILVIAVIIALIYLIWGGIKWITSGGDKGNVETARNQIIAAIIGLIVAFLAWFIIGLVLQLFFGRDAAGGFTIPQIDLTGSTTEQQLAPGQGRK